MLFAKQMKISSNASTNSKIHISINLKVSCKILRIDDLFQSLEEAKSNKEYLIVMDIVGKLKHLIDDPTDKIFNRLECYHIIKVNSDWIIASSQLFWH